MPNSSETSGGAEQFCVSANTKIAEELIAQGNASEDAGDVHAALARYLEAATAAPDHPKAHLNVGNALRLLGRLPEAIAAQREALLCKPDYPAAHFNLASLLVGSGDFVEAEMHLREALRHYPGMADAAIVLADVLEATSRIAEAEATLRGVISIRPDYAGAMLNLGQLYLRQGRFDDAENVLLQAPTEDPTFLACHGALASLYFKKGCFSEAARTMAVALALDPELPQCQSSYLFSLNLRDDMETRAVFHEHARLGASIAKAAGAPYEVWPNTAVPARRIRLGYISGDFGMHPIGLFMLPVFRGHDRAKFEVHCYSNRRSGVRMTQELRRFVDGWHEIDGASDIVVCDQIRRDEIDILVDLAGHSDGNRLGVFAMHPAPVQATWLGYLNTTGLPGMEYRICDRHTDPPGSAEPLHTERLYRMPNSQWCYAPVYEVPLIEQPHPEHPETIVFGSFNQYAKISDACLDLWCRVLVEVPESKLVVLDVPAGNTRDILRRRMAQRDVDVERILVQGRKAIGEYFAAIGNTDIAFDTFPYNGATTTLDTLWMGVPMIALCGERAISRSSYSILQSLPATEWIAGDADEYVRLNVQLARDAALRKSLRSTLRRRLERSPLMDATVFVRDLETGYQQMWREWCSSPDRINS